MLLGDLWDSAAVHAMTGHPFFPLNAPTMLIKGLDQAGDTSDELSLEDSWEIKGTILPGTACFNF